MKSVDIAVPVYYGNIPQIEESVKKQITAYKKIIRNYNWNIVLAINGPDKGITDFAKKVVGKYENVKYTYTPVAGKGAGIKNCWRLSKADIVAYTDVDLSAGIESFTELIEAVSKDYDLALGSKYLTGSEIRRVNKRDLISRIYHTFFTKIFIGIRTSDVHCGLKALKKDSFDKILPFVKDNQWFFDTELMFFATKSNFLIKEVPVIWTDSGLPSGVKIYRTAIKFIWKIIEMKFRFALNRDKIKS